MWKRQNCSAYSSLRPEAFPSRIFGNEIGIPRVRILLKQGKDAIAHSTKKWVPQFLVDRSAEILNRDECRMPRRGVKNRMWASAGLYRTLAAHKEKLDVQKPEAQKVDYAAMSGVNLSGISF